MVSSLSSVGIRNDYQIVEAGSEFKPAAKEPAHDEALDRLENDSRNSSLISSQTTGVKLPNCGASFNAAKNIAISSSSAAGKSSSTIIIDQDARDQLVANIKTQLKNDPAATKAFTSLTASAAFKKLDFEAQEAILAQCKNFPNSHSIETLEKMSSVKWFTKMKLPDQQRAAKCMAYLAETAITTPGSDQNILIDNTMNRLLSNQIPLHFEDIKDDPGCITYGYAPAFGSGIYINSKLVPDGNDPFPKNDSQARHAAISTIVHETSHQVNKDVNRATYQYFQEEYKAWYVGWIAEYGTPPSRVMAYCRCCELIDIYDNIHSAMYDDDFFNHALDAINKKLTGDEMENIKIANFLNQFAGLSEVKVETDEDIRRLMNSPCKNPRDPAPLPDPSLKFDLDN